MRDLASPPERDSRYLTDKERAEVIGLRLSGVEVKDIAVRYDIDESTVWRICKLTQDAAKTVTQDWRAEQAQLAVQSVNRALVDDSDTYKSAGIAVQALKG